MPKDKKAILRKKGKFGNLPLPVDLIEELRDWKLSYEVAWSDPSPDGKPYKMTMEQLIRRLLEGVKRIDPEVWATHEAAKKTRQEQAEMMADFRENFWGMLYQTKTKLDGLFEDFPLDGNSPVADQEQVKEKEVPAMNPDGTFQLEPTEGEIRDMKYFFMKDGEKLEAHDGDLSPFFAYVQENGKKRRKGFKDMLADGWILMNDEGIEFKDIDEAWNINHLIRSQASKEKGKD